MVYGGCRALFSAGLGDWSSNVVLARNPTVRVHKFVETLWFRFGFRPLPSREGDVRLASE